MIVFFATCASVDYHNLALKLLLDKDVNQVWKLHGKINQKKRTQIYQEFKSEQKTTFNKLLITTDLAARGIDIPDVDWII
jgi:superfamily II DNA/RNA helicase